MLLHTINQAALVKSTDNSGNSCNMRASCFASFRHAALMAFLRVLIDWRQLRCSKSHYHTLRQ